MEEYIRVHDQHYILATSARVDDRTRILKHNDTFAVFDRSGNIQPFGLGEQGIYHEDTRYLSRLDLHLAQRRLILLGPTVQEEKPILSVDLTNPDIPLDATHLLPRDSLHLFRHGFLWNAAFYSKIRIKSYHGQTLRVQLSFLFEADFADVFEVRGSKRQRRGNFKPPIIDGNVLALSYEGLDGVHRMTRLEFEPGPSELTASAAKFLESFEPGEEKNFLLTVRCLRQERRFSFISFPLALEQCSADLQEHLAREARVETSNEPFNHWINRSASDLRMMTTKTSDGPYPYAGIPWYSTVFGRDGLVTAYQCLAFQPFLAKGVLQFLASNQAVELEPERDAQPGKILHEMRLGEMANLNEVPFGRYYGSVDSTPLFLLLCGAYFERTGDIEFIRSLWKHIEAALRWIDEFGDIDGDGFVEYYQQSPRGLATQGWKDSVDSVFHRDGRLAQPPVALCEVQAYVYAAKHAAAKLARILDQPHLEQTLRSQAEQLKDRFDQAFWCDDLGTFAIALDREKNRCCVRTSNAGQCLFTGIVKPSRIEPLVRTLLDENSFSGWGVRTVALSESRYNPMSYHNGSIWPHDNSLIAAGLAACGCHHEALRIFGSLFDASQLVESYRMPELLCGFGRREDEGPTLYPVACAPQAWACGAVFLLLRSCLGIFFEAPANRIRIIAPTLPHEVSWINISNMQLKDAVVDLHFRRDGQDVVVAVPRKRGNVQVTIVK